MKALPNLVAVRTRSLELRAPFSCTVATREGSKGPLQDIDQPVEVRTSGGTIVMLSLSGGVRSADPTALLAEVVEALLRAATERGDDIFASMLSVRKHLCTLDSSGHLHEGLPHGVIMNISPDGEVVGWRLGPVGIAAVESGSVRLLHEDDRIPALERAGATLKGVIPDGLLNNKLLSRVTSLVQLNSEDHSVGAVPCSVPHDGAILLMSRGAFPFSPPGRPLLLEDWLALDAGWNYGLSGTLAWISRGA